MYKKLHSTYHITCANEMTIITVITRYYIIGTIHNEIFKSPLTRFEPNALLMQ